MKASSNFRANLRKAVAAAGVSQRELANDANVSYPYVNRVLNEHVTDPSIDHCEKLAAALGYSLADMLVSPREFKAHKADSAA